MSSFKAFATIRDKLMATEKLGFVEAGWLLDRVVRVQAKVKHYKAVIRKLRKSRTSQQAEQTIAFQQREIERLTSTNTRLQQKVDDLHYKIAMLEVEASVSPATLKQENVILYEQVAELWKLVAQTKERLYGLRP